jgi:hypothetical protein
MHRRSRPADTGLHPPPPATRALRVSRNRCADKTNERSFGSIQEASMANLRTDTLTFDDSLRDTWVDDDFAFLHSKPGALRHR